MVLDYSKIPGVPVLGMRGGVGTLIIQKIVEEGRTFARITLPPHTSIGPHFHTDDEEYVVIESGMGECLQENEWVPLKAGMVHLNRKGEQHSIRNESSDNFVILAHIVRY